MEKSAMAASAYIDPCFLLIMIVFSFPAKNPKQNFTLHCMSAVGKSIQLINIFLSNGSEHM